MRAEIAARRRSLAALLVRAGELEASVAVGKATLGDLVNFLANTLVAQHLFKVDRKFFPLFNHQAARGISSPS